MGSATALVCATTIAALQLPLSRFAEEEITIDVWAQEIRVTGVYRYENVLPISMQQGLVIPFRTDRGDLPPFEISTRPAHLVRLLGTYRCDLDLPPRAESVLWLRYRQYVPSQRGVYLLTTTRPWRRPLRRGRYRIIPHGVTISGSNYPLRAAGDALEFVRSDFMPRQDWRFSWQ